MEAWKWKTELPPVAAAKMNSSAVRFDDFLGDRQTQAHARRAVGAGDAEEFLEHAGRVLGWNADAGVFDDEGDLAVVVFRRDGHRTAGRCEFQALETRLPKRRVTNERRIHFELRQVGRAGHLKPHAFLLERRLHRFDYRSKNLRRREPAEPRTGVLGPIRSG